MPRLLDKGLKYHAYFHNRQQYKLLNFFFRKLDIECIFLCCKRMPQLILCVEDEVYFRFFFNKKCLHRSPKSNALDVQ